MRGVRAVLLAVFLALALGGLATPAGGGSPGPMQTAIASDTQAAVDAGTALAASGDTVVYKTETGKKYHKDGCRHLSKSKIKTTLKAAKAAGLEPCSVCKPPT